MKKTEVIMIALMAIGGAVFAQSFTVQNVSGRVERETAGKWETVKAGDIVTEETVVRTGIAAALTLASDGQTFSVGAVQTGKVAALIENTVGIRIDGRVVQTDTGAVNRTTGRVSTASARASNAAAEEDIAAE
jgi:hypothetical protein